MDRYTQNTYPNQAYTNQNRSSGYDSAATINSRPNAMYETSNPSNGYEQKWAQWFGQPPFGHYQTDNYAMLGHENYQLPTAYIGRNREYILACLLACLHACLRTNHALYSSHRKDAERVHCQRR